ncbi:LOW QUALITY PROTEIN: WD repeat-containing protein 73 [Heteronotia binoei]|uniref:LOW QUALITY PROTEIN: WD repeat-containing protein 73 n=1 Tax=Heteronotia binoei TaxID=13085 RepID=UPI002930E04C|nr:LOW QUALITY PROTEIN: WD repeat-containing protein 73 [Heteronotia binoei]
MREEDEEGWLLDSLRLYNDLHVFELHEPTRVVTWTGEKRVCIAGYSDRRRNEILQLLLPPRLTAKENQGLCPERDFKVEHGGFSDRPVYSLKHVPETSLLVTSGPPDSSLQVWRVEQNETDVIKLMGTIPTVGGEEPTWARIATAPSKSAWVLHGLKISDVQVTEIESRKTVFRAASTSHDELSALEFVDRATALACSTTGHLFLADVRQPQGLLGVAEEPHVALATGGGRWCAAVRPGPPESVGNHPQVVRLSDGGCIVLTDLRNTTSPLKVATGCAPPSGPPASEFLCVSFAPQLEECLAVSGFDGTVCIYSNQSWGPAPQEDKPLFVHRGHIFSSAEAADRPVLVTAHSWHPSKPRTLLSAATDGSLHAWDWSEPRRAS